MPIIDDGLYSDRGYIAPTVYKKQGVQINAGINYYSDLAYAVSKYYFLSGTGGVDIDPAGMVTFAPDTTAQTLGINVDFYIYYEGAWQFASYGFVKGLLSWPPMVFRFYTTDGNGPFYAIFNPDLMGMSATPVDSVSADELAALDSLYREAQLLKYRYNSLCGFLNTLAQRQLTPQEQQIFNEGTLRLNSMTAEMGQLQGIEFTFTAKGATIGIIPFLIIAIVAILAVVASWTIQQIVSMQQKTKQINDAYQLNEWIATKKQEIAGQVQAGTISQSDADAINKNLDSASASANKIASNAAANTGGGFFAQLGPIIKWGVIGFLAIEFVPPIKNLITKKTTS